MTDIFEDHALSLSSPVTAADAITPDDGADLAHVTRALYVGVGGELSVVMLSGDTVTFSNVSPGMLYPLRLSRVLSTGTTAGALVGLY